MTKIEELKNEIYEMYWTATCDLGKKCFAAMDNEKKYRKLCVKRAKYSRWARIFRDMTIDEFRYALHTNQYGIQQVLFKQN